MTELLRFPVRVILALRDLLSVPSKGGVSMPVFFKCKSCGGTHPSPIGFGDKRSFDNAQISGNTLNCPKTGQVASYDKKDMLWRD